ncbi:class I SAM-dependent methyltransferase [Nocardia sp. NPDC020380]|uniref:class I SAM-dependent methyltransferase n=1 Tax=Nocardia sp. NPDC020380 TaxID=3364309 RepID=UPI0037AF9658
MTTFGAKRSRHFDATQSRQYEGIATRLNQGLYRRIAADVDDLTAIGATVLDAGTGPGLLLEHIARRRPDLGLHGIDLSPHMIELAENRMLAHPVELAVGDVTALPYPDNSFDIVLSSLSLHEWTDVPEALDELQRVLRPGGRLAVYDFRFVRTGHALAVLRISSDDAHRENIRLPGHPIGLFVRLVNWAA